MDGHPHLGSVSGTLMRGGTSKGLFVREGALPADPERRDAIVLSLFGSPDPLQLNGIGGGKSHTSKLVVVGPDDDFDVRYTFAQVGVAEAEVDWSKNSGNVASAVGHYAVAEGLVTPRAPATEVTLRNTNTGTVIDQRVPVTDGAPAILGDYAIDGVPGSGAKIPSTYRDPGGSVTGDLLPTGRAVDRLELEGGGLDVSVVDVGSLIAFVRAADLGLSGTELPDRLAAETRTLDRLEAARARIRERLGLTDAKRSNPSIGIVSPPQPYACSVDRSVDAASTDVTARFVSLQPHHAISMTGAMCLGAAIRIPETVPAELARGGAADEVTIGHPKGTVTVGVESETRDGTVRIASTTNYRTACPLADAEVFYRKNGHLVD